MSDCSYVDLICNQNYTTKLKTYSNVIFLEKMVIKIYIGTS